MSVGLEGREPLLDHRLAEFAFRLPTHLRRGSLGLAASEFKKALRFKKQVIVPYFCSNCRYSTIDWSGRCPHCGKWNTFGVDLGKSS